MAAFLAVVWGLSLTCYMFGNVLNILLYVHPLWLFGFCVVFLFNPVRVLHFRARRWLLKVLVSEPSLCGCWGQFRTKMFPRASQGPPKSYLSSFCLERLGNNSSVFPILEARWPVRNRNNCVLVTVHCRARWCAWKA